MPPKKRRVAPVREKLGIARQFLHDNFSAKGDSVLKNGHILLYHLENQRSVIKTINYAKGILGENVQISPYQVTSLVKRSVDKYKSLADKTEMMKLTLICTGDFLPSHQQVQDPLDNSLEAPGNTQEAPDNTRDAPGNTQEAPDNSLEAPGNTQDAPDNTQEAPDNTQEAPDNTQEAPDKTRDAPDSERSSGSMTMLTQEPVTLASCDTPFAQQLSVTPGPSSIVTCMMSNETIPKGRQSLELTHKERLLDAASRGDIEEFTSLLSSTNAVDTDVKNERGWTALMLAARNGQVPVIKALLEKGCDVNILNSSGQSALEIASFWDHNSARELLSEHTKSAGDEPYYNYYSRNPLYRAGDKRSDQTWINSAMQKPSTKFTIFSDLRPFLLEVNHPHKKHFYKLGLFNYDHVSFHIAEKPLVIFLGLETWDPESAAWFALDVTGVEESRFTDIYPDGYFAEPFPVTMQMEETHAGIFAEAQSVLTWHDRYSFCSTCGSSTTVHEAGYKRVCDNEDCRSRKGVHNTCHPRVDPSLIMLVVSKDGKRCLLGRKKVFPPKMYSCLAGFMEPGESIEDTCRREVEEESGIKVGQVEYHSSQPWPFPAVLMLGCITHAKTDTIKLDEVELEDARWFSRPEVAQMLAHQHPGGLFVPPSQAIAHRLVKSWISRTSNL